MVWGITYLFPTSMRGLYSSNKTSAEEVDAYKTLDKVEKQEKELPAKQGWVDMPNSQSSVYNINYGTSHSLSGGAYSL